MIFKWKASETLRRREALESGQPGPRYRETPVSFPGLDPEQRAAVLGLVKSVDDLNTQQIDAGGAYIYDPSRFSPVAEIPIEFDTDPTIADLIAAAQRRQASEKEARALEAADRAAKEAKEAADKRKAAESKAAEEARNAASQETLDALIAELNADMDDPDVTRSRLADLESFTPTTEDQMKQLRAAAKVAWIYMHGSDHLRRATDAGYNSQRRYVTERAAHDAPGWDLDFDDGAAWSGRSDPSPAALDALAEAEHLARTLTRKRFAPTPEIVWLTAPASNEADPQARGIDAYDFEPCEAVTIRGYLGRYDLIRTI